MTWHRRGPMDKIDRSKTAKYFVPRVNVAIVGIESPSRRQTVTVAE